MTPPQSLAGRVAVVTGAARGLGRAHALELARRGAAVVVNDVSAAAEDVVEEIRSAGGRAVACVHTVATAAGGSAIVEAAVDAFGSVDVVVNNAGFARNASFGDLAAEDFDAVLDVHVRGAFNVTQPAWRVMQRQGYGRIVMTSSGSGVFGRPAGAAYCTAKAALVGLTKALAHDGRALGIGVNCILPVAATEFVAENPLPPSDLAVLEDVLGGVDGRKEPERVSALVAWLASEDCDANGEIYSACLGRYARGFFAVTGGWVGPREIAVAEELAAHRDEIEALEGVAAPSSVFDEMGLAAQSVRRLASR